MPAIFFPVRGQVNASVSSDFKASVMGPLPNVTNWDGFKRQLQTLKNNGIYAITTDVWWGNVESAGDNVFDWSYYKTYADAVRSVGLKWVPILSTHTCGGNPGDDCNIPIPNWLWSKGSADEMKYKNETGFVNGEAISPFWSGIGQQYNDLYASFAQNFSSYKDIIPKIYLSAGPSGELRYPSYYNAAGWSYPSRGKFQVYTETAKNAFRTAMISKYGSLNGVNSAWGLQLTSQDQINPPSDGDGFYTSGGHNTTYGKDFLRWYQSVLENHLGLIAQKAHANLDSVFGVRIGAKVSGVHWQFSNPSMPHSAEQAAGYYDYNSLIQKFKDSDLDLTFTCLEMFDDNGSSNFSKPSTLVDTISSIANAKGVRLNGENALQASGSGAFQKIEEKITRFGYVGFTLLRLQHIVNGDGSPQGDMELFKNHVVKYSTPDVRGDNKVTIYYKKGFSNPNIHYRPAGGTWTTAPGKPMPESEVPGYTKLTIDIGGATQLEACFNDGSTWDNNNRSNYMFGVGTFTYTPDSNGGAGTIKQGAPDGGGEGNKVTVYYKKGFSNPNIHYRPAGGAWTTVPGKPMPESEVPGYAKLTVDIGTATQLEACFNDGSTWDNNNRTNYLFGVGTFTFTPGSNGGAGTIKQGAPDGGGEGNKVTVYYKKGFSNPNIHFRPAGGTWTTAPGKPMPESEVPGYTKLTIDIGSATQLEACFNDGGGTWDNNNRTNYLFGVGTFTFTPGSNGGAGTIKQGAPDGGGEGNKVTVYYKKGFSNPNIHYRPAGGEWTTAPGKPMPASEVSGYTKVTIDLGTATQLEACFNDGGSAWDNNNRSNYLFGVGTFTFTPSNNGGAGTIKPGEPGDVTPIDPVDWSSQSIYFIMTDRFSDGDPSNNNYGGFNADKNDPKKYHGGDFQGIINNLDYIKNMGFTAIWITPVTMQASEFAYHGYHTYDFYSVDGHLGGMDKLKELVKTAHSKKIAVMLDVVPNHTGDFNFTAKAPFDKWDWYHHAGTITDQDYDTGNQWKIENGEVANLDDLNQDNPDTANELKHWIQWLRNETGIDGLRLDTAKHMPKNFMREFNDAAGLFTIGEVMHGDPAFVGDYTNFIDAVVDFPMYYTIRDVFAYEQSMKKITSRYGEDSNYRDAKLNGLFVDNHDVVRFLNMASGNPSNRSDKWPQLKAALGFILTSRGIPIVYQGTEQGHDGGKDPDNRRDMTFNANHDLYKYIAKLNFIRNNHPALQNGSQKEKWADDSFYSYQRSKNGDEAIVMINNSWSSQTRTISNFDNLSNGTKLVNQMGTDSVTINNGSVTVTLGPKEVKIFTK